MVVDPYLTVGERVGGGDNVPSNQFLETLIRSVKPALYLKPAPPVLLAFTAQVRQPRAFAFLCPKTCKDGVSVGPKSSPVSHRTHREYRATVRTSPSLYPQRIDYCVEESGYISMTPDTITVAANTSFRPRPTICFSKCL
jgi:hypothetical protein